MPAGGASVAWIDARDIADVATVALLDPARFAGLKATLTGPAAVPLRRVTDWLSAAIGEPVHSAEGTIDDAVAGLDPWLAGIVGGVCGRVRSGTFGDTTDEVARITGTTPRSLQNFVVEHAALWRE